MNKNKKIGWNIFFLVTIVTFSQKLWSKKPIVYKCKYIHKFNSSGLCVNKNM